MVWKGIHRCLVICFFWAGISQTKAQNKAAIAKFNFNNKSDRDEVNGHKAKFIGAHYTSDRFNNPNSAIFLHGNFHSYVNLGSYSALKPKVGSISLWVKIEIPIWAGKGPKYNPIIITKNTSSDDFYEAYAMYFVTESGRLSCLSSRDSLREIGILSENGSLLNQWHHLVMAYNDEHLWWYIDGKCEGKSLKGFETNFLESDSVVIGTTASKKNERYMLGNVDDIEIYDHVLTGEEVLDLYHAPNPNKNRVILNWIFLGLAFLILIMIIYLFIRYRLSITLKKEKQRLELYNIVLETELRVNRALMNPHFVFNSLNALQNFILKNENARANNYLVKFSKLMRRILESNMSDTITLELEIELLQRYLEIEDLRFEENIKHTIIVDPAIAPSSIKIPIMMLQPFIENAIWHGLLKKQGEKLLTISFSPVENSYILCVIEDNGMGRKKQDTEFLEKKSLATGFIEQRLNLLNKLHHLNCTLSIEDKPNQGGTIVKIFLPILKK